MVTTLRPRDRVQYTGSDSLGLVGKTGTVDSEVKDFSGTDTDPYVKVRWDGGDNWTFNFIRNLTSLEMERVDTLWYWCESQKWPSLLSYCSVDTHPVMSYQKPVHIHDFVCACGERHRTP